MHEHDMNPLISVRKVNKAYVTSAGTFDALRNINLTVGKSEFIAIVGKSGSGKTTMMNLLAGIDKPTSGEILIENNSIHAMNENQLAKWRGLNVGVVFQFFQLLPTLSILENVMLPMDFCNVFTKARRLERALDLLDQVGIRDQAFKFPTALSGGQQQRAAIARSLANDPPIILADEPTGNLDSNTAKDIFAIFGELVRNGKTILVVTHDQDIAARCTGHIRLVDGQIAA